MMKSQAELKGKDKAKVSGCLSALASVDDTSFVFVATSCKKTTQDNTMVKPQQTEEAEEKALLASTTEISCCFKGTKTNQFGWAGCFLVWFGEGPAPKPAAAKKTLEEQGMTGMTLLSMLTPSLNPAFKKKISHWNAFFDFQFSV